MNKRLPIYELEINDNIDDESEVNFISLVDSPAIEKDFMFFNKQEFINPTKGENKDEFLPRCIKYVVGEGKESGQAVAICNSLWVEHFAEVGPRGGIKESDKAPKSDTPNKDPKGEGSAKGDASGKRGAEVTQAQEKTLQDKADEFNNKESNTKNGRATLGALKSVFQRGLGAYNTSHSPLVKSAEQWAYARVNAFLYLLKNGRPENAKYTTDYDLLPKDHPKADVKMNEEFAEESYTDYPQAAINNAKTALRWAEENGWGDCGTPVGKIRANQLANNEPISRDTIARMSAFERHRQYSQRELGDGCARLMWLAWGGDAGIEWATRKLKQIDKEMFAALKVSIDYDDTLSTTRGKELVRRLIKEGDTVYIISARHSSQGMYKTADELGIPHSRVYATGSNNEKINKIKELGIEKHYDNNSDVVKQLKNIGEKFLINEKFDITNEEQRIISGPIMLANSLIYRNSPENGEHYVKFTKDTIKAIAIKFAKKKYQNRINLMHEDNSQVQGVTMFESFITDEKRGIQPMVGFEDVPDGSWFGSFFVENDEVWQGIKDGIFKGFSVEGLFSMEDIKDTKTDEEVFELLKQINHILNNYKNKSPYLKNIK